MAGEVASQDGVEADRVAGREPCLGQEQGRGQGGALLAQLDRRLLSICKEGGIAWAWLGGSTPLQEEKLEHHLSTFLPTQIQVAIGEPGRGIDSWRLTHRQARAALPIALRSPRGFTRYAEVALLAAALQDDLLTTSLRQLFLGPALCDREGNETLRAYFAAQRNVSSTAAALGVSRQTVTNRLRATEQRLGRSLSGCAAELEIVLRMEEFANREPDCKPSNMQGHTLSP